MRLIDQARKHFSLSIHDVVGEKNPGASEARWHEVLEKNKNVCVCEIENNLSIHQPDNQGMDHQIEAFILAHMGEIVEHHLKGHSHEPLSKDTLNKMVTAS
jgi:hypothetical protein